MKFGAEADSRYGALEDRFYGETIASVRQSGASPAQKRQWLMDAMQVLARAEDAMSGDPGEDPEGFLRALGAIERAAQAAR